MNNTVLILKMQMDTVLKFALIMIILIIMFQDKFYLKALYFLK